MTQPPRVPDDLLARLADQGVDATEVVSVRPLAGGACQDNFQLEVRQTDGSVVRFVLRSDATSSLPGSIDRATESAAIDAAVRAGVPTPAVRARLVDLNRPGSTALLLEWRDGVAIGARVLRDPALAAAREGLPRALASALARVHSVTPEATPAFAPPRGFGPPAQSVQFCREMLDNLAPRAGLELVVRWLERNAPAPVGPRLVHGDFRVGNFLVTPAGLSAVLDWEFSHWGSPACDLGWFCVRDWRFGRVDREAGGLVRRQQFVDLYRAEGGFDVSLDELHWWEVLGNVRWATGASFQGTRVSGEARDLEMLAIARRSEEMEFEALSLVSRGPADRALVVSRAVSTLPPPDPAPAPPAEVGADDRLLAAVAGLLESEVVAALTDPALAFRVRIAAHVLGVIRRSAASGEQLEAERVRVLAALLGVNGDGREAEPLEAAVALAVREGRFDEPEVAGDAVLALRDLALARARLGQPKFS